MADSNIAAEANCILIVACDPASRYVQCTLVVTSNSLPDENRIQRFSVGLFALIQKIVRFFWKTNVVRAMVSTVCASVLMPDL